MTESVHYVASWFSCAPPRGRTACGIVVFKTRTANEADTEDNERVDYAEIWSSTNCTACLRSVDYRRRPKKRASGEEACAKDGGK